MNEVVNDINRPDVNGVAPKMQEIAERLSARVDSMLNKPPYVNIQASDNLLSTVSVRGSFEAKETWLAGIFYNSRYFVLNITSHGSRYYENGSNVTVELFSKGVEVNKFRKYTGSVDKVIVKIVDWLTV